MAKTDTPKSVRIENIEIKGYKGIDHLRLDFPKPRMADDPDIFVLGSANGVGKTSVLECCSLLMLAFMLNAGKGKFRYDDASLLKSRHLLDLLINANMDSAEIKGLISYGGEKVDTAIALERNGEIVPHVSLKSQDLLPGFSKIDVNHFIESVCGLTSNSFFPNQCFLMLHGYRKIKEGGVQLRPASNANLSTEEINLISRFDDSENAFKRDVINLKLAEAGVLENISSPDGFHKNINKLNDLMSIYIENGFIEKLKLLDDHSYDIRVKLKDSNNSFSFDTLSSGQKEIVSTLFMIWRHTQNNPTLVMIDEPELHLNAQWHSSVIRSLTKNLPHNQYIIATHSEDIMNAVNKDRRLFLLPEPQGSDNECTR